VPVIVEDEIDDEESVKAESEVSGNESLLTSTRQVLRDDEVEEDKDDDEEDDESDDPE
jgi:hypothetical protein